MRTRHARGAHVDPGRLWAAARTVRLSDTRTLGRLVRWRIPGLPDDLTYHALFRAYPFVALDEGERHLVAGLCGRIWTRARDYPRLAGADDFAAWREPGTVRVLFAHWAEPWAAGARLVSEARVAPTDPDAAARLRALWSLVAPFERLVGAEAVAAAARRAEARGG